MSKNMQGFGMMIQKLKASPKRIVFTEGTDERILEAVSRLLASNFLTPILVGKEDEVQTAAEEYGYNIRGAQIIDPENFDRMDEMIAMFCELRKSKNVQPDEARKILSAGNYFGTMLVKMGVADALLGGATYSTADTEIAIESAECGRIFGIDPKVAFLSYSTLGSGKGEDVDKMRTAAAMTKEKAPDLPIAGELQFDAAVSPRVARTKCPGNPVAGHANVFVFPDINAGNIGYKIAQRLGNFDAYGPILLGLNAPINDLSRGCNAEEVYSMAIITAALAE